MKNLTQNALFQNFYSFLIITNAIILCLEGLIDQYPLDIFQNVLLFFYILEFLIKVTISPLKKYFKDQINIIDILALLYLIYNYFNNSFSIIDRIESQSSSESITIEALNYLRFFRILLILKILRLFSYFSYMHFIMQGIRKTFSEFIYIAFLLLLLIIIYAGYGFQLFQGEILAYQSYWYSLMSVLQVITLDNWYDMFAECYGKCDKLATLCFFLSLIILGNYIFLNLFIALVLDGFETLSKNDENHVNNHNIEEKDQSSDSEEEEEKLGIEEFKCLESRNFNEFLQKFKYDVDFEAKVMKRRLPFLVKSSILANRRATNRLAQRSKTILTDKDLNLHLLKTMQLKLNFMEIEYKALKEKYSLFFFSKKSEFRRNCFFLTRSRCFTMIINIVIMTNSIKFGLDTWIDWENPQEDLNLKRISNYCDFIFLGIFALEAGLKIVAEGLFISKESYLRNPFNFINFLNILGTLISQFVQDQTLIVFKVYSINIMAFCL